MKNKGYLVNCEPINISDDSDEEYIPLKNIVAETNGCAEDQNSYDSLCKHKREACEFCDRISKNRYSSLIHNVSHIIIPLLNQTVFQCPTCLHSFTSKRDLRLHILKKHPDEAEDLEPLVNYSNKKQRTSHTSNGSIQPRQPENNTNAITNGTKNSDTKAETIKNRLQFEEDDLVFLNGANEKQLLIDLTTDCKVKLETFNTPWLNGEVVPDEFCGKSVHYNDLMKPGVYRCKKCGKRFPARFDAIVHESYHIQFKNSQVSLCVICKKYLIGGKNDLRHHYITFHKGNMVKSLDEEYKSKLIFEEEEKSFDSKFIFLCNLCLSFSKNTSSIMYDCITTKSEIGKRYECEKCGQLFFDVNVVKRSIQRRALFGSHTQKKRKKTNTERLKTIASRFKKLKH